MLSSVLLSETAFLDPRWVDRNAGNADQDVPRENRRLATAAASAAVQESARVAPRPEMGRVLPEQRLLHRLFARLTWFFENDTHGPMEW